MGLVKVKGEGGHIHTLPTDPPPEGPREGCLGGVILSPTLASIPSIKHTSPLFETPTYVCGGKGGGGYLKMINMHVEPPAAALV